MKKISPWLFLLLIGCGPPIQIDWPASNPIHEQKVAEAGWLKIIVLDVGQGDATVLIGPNQEAILIDTGPKEIGDKAALKVLEEQGIATLEHIFISHNHEDHTGGLENILKTLSIERAKVMDKNRAKAGQTVALGPVQIEIKAANGQIGNALLITEEEREDENNLSLALLVEYGNFRYFTSGDLPGGGGEPPYDTIDLETPLAPLVGDIDIFLIPHHGSHTSTNENFLRSLKPEIGILTVGNDNEFFHPHPSTIKRLKEFGVKIYQTERGWLKETQGVEIVNGHICILTDGETYFVKPYAIDNCTPPP